MLTTMPLGRWCAKLTSDSFFQTTTCTSSKIRWNSSNKDWRPGDSWTKVSRSAYNPKYFNFERIRSKFRFRVPTKLEVLEFLWRGPKSLRIPDSVTTIIPYRGILRPGKPINRQSFVFSFFRVVYNYMDNPAKNVMLYYRPTAFSALFATTSYVGCTIWSYENGHSRQQGGCGSGPGSSLNPFNWKIPLPRFIGASDTTPATSSTDGEVITVNLLSFEIWGWVKENKRELRKKLKHWWDCQATETDKIFWPIFALNAIVYVGWRFDVFASWMVPYFTASPTSRFICWPFLLSSFSHYSFTHFALNMFVLHSFLPAAVSLLGKHYALYLYLTGGVLSSYGSHMFKMFKGNTIPSLGASGAIMAVLGFVCTQTPDAKLGIVFVPGLNFSADTGLKCLMAMDFAGLFANWRLMDHAAHFSGALLGILYSHACPHLEPVREMILKGWHSIRTFGR